MSRFAEAPSPEALARAGSLLRSGGLVAFPTETVYGLGAAALDPAAASRVFAVKQRPRFDPLICHVDGADGVASLVSEVPDAARRLAERFWPGPLTLVLPKRPEVPDLVTAGEPTVAVRVPAHPVALGLLTAFGGPIAAPSANRFGAVSPTRAEHVIEQLGDAVDLVLDGGPCSIGIESTILRVLPGQRPELLRPGGLPLEAIEAVVGAVDVPPPTAFPSAAPGRLARHYATRARLVLAEEGGVVEAPAGGRVGYLAFRSAPVGDRFAAVEVLAPRGDLAEAAQRLFAALRRLDAAALDLIVAERVPSHGLGRAIMDRLSRAAAPASGGDAESAPTQVDP